jgi:hypothetical protein
MAQKGETEMSKLFHGGAPYVIDVRRLMDAFPVPSLEEGRVIKHEQLEGVVNSVKGSQRYYAVINSWIHQMRNSNGIYIIWEPSVGVKVLDPAGILSHAEIRTRQKLRQTGRAIKIYAFVNRDRLNSIGQQRLDHEMRVASVLGDALRAAKKEMAISLAPIKSLPKPQLVREA